MIPVAVLLSLALWSLLWITGGPLAVLLVLSAGILAGVSVGMWMHLYPGGPRRGDM